MANIDNLVREALLALQLDMPADNTYHPLYKAWREFHCNPFMLKSVKDKAAFGNGMVIFLSYQTESDIDTRQEIASVAYLFLSMAIEENPSNINLIKNRVLLMLQNQEDLCYTVSSALNKNSDFFSISMFPSQEKEGLHKMIFADIENNPDLTTIDVFAECKRELDTMIANGNFGSNETKSSLLREGQNYHSEVLSYLKKKVFEEENIDF